MGLEACSARCSEKIRAQTATAKIDRFVSLAAKIKFACPTFLAHNVRVIALPDEESIYFPKSAQLKTGKKCFVRKVVDPL